LLVALTVAVIGWRAAVMLQVNGWTPLRAAIFALFLVLVVPIALSFWTAVIGFVVRCRGGDTLDLTRALAEAPAPSRLPRTAIVMPVYNEDPGRVFAGLKATYESLEQTGRLAAFDIFVLSDTTDPDIWVREEMAFAQLRKEVSDPDRLIYRNRRENVERKTGNIADFCATWGDRYRYMVVFDADSIMTGASLVNLVRLMERHPRVGIIQAPPLPVNRRTLFGRVHQFAMHAYSTVFITGLNFWQGGAANYWGHNAIIRIEPFVEHCRLPKLPGKPPLGGSILSHDFVEAAFMRRAGWRVYLASELRGSYEEMPSSLIGYAARDRRWCQGNLQHARLLLTPGLHLVSRVHIWMGVMSYAASPLWLALLVLTTIEGLSQNLGPHDYFPPGKSLFPVWRVSVEGQALGMFLLMMSLLLLPKALGALLHLLDRERAAAFGGRGRLLASVTGETLLSALLAPNLALLQARFVIGTLLGRNVSWDAQDRGDEGTTWGEAWRRHWFATLLGLLWTGLLAFAAPKLLAWFSPVIAGFLLSAPLSAWSSQSRAGDWAKARGLFLIGEELAPPAVLRRLRTELDQAPERPWSAGGDGLGRVLGDAEVYDLHLSLVTGLPDDPDPLREHRIEGLRLRLLQSGLSSLSKREKRELLLDPSSLAMLRCALPGRDSPRIPTPAAF
jgi:membrane glycosyltransferase